jgi:hypothetical protein
MIRYLSDVINVYSPKNKLEDQIIAFLQTEKRLLIRAEQVEIYKDSILKSIHNINKQHNRCKPVSASWWLVGEDDTPEEYRSYRLNLNNHSICIFSLTAGEEFEI